MPFKSYVALAQATKNIATQCLDGYLLGAGVAISLNAEAYEVIHRACFGTRALKHVGRATKGTCKNLTVSKCS